MAESWPKVKLADCVELLAGFAFKSDQFTDSSDDIALVKGENVAQGRIAWQISKRWPAADWDRMTKYQLRPGDVVVAMDRPWIPAGLKWGFIRASDPRALLVQRVARLRASNGQIDQNFLRFVIGSQGFEDYVRPITSGVNVPHISGSQILDFDFPLPPLSVQKRVAAILSAYDDLIENNQRRIRILEEMAQALYREWFVEFRLPGGEKTNCVTSAIGPIPEGWKVDRIGNRFRTVLGGTPSRTKSELWEGGTVPWINSGKVNDLRITEASEFITPLALEKSAAKLMPRGTTVLAITGATLGQVSYLEIETAANQSVVGISDPSGLLSEWIYLTVKERIDEIVAHASGGAQQHINKEIVANVVVALPPDAVANAFRRIVQPIFAQLATLLFQNKNLLATRELLLPKLLQSQ